MRKNLEDVFSYVSLGEKEVKSRPFLSNNRTRVPSLGRFLELATFSKLDLEAIFRADPGDLPPEPCRRGRSGMSEEAKLDKQEAGQAGTDRHVSCKGFRATGHWKCWMITILLWGLLVSRVICHVRIEEFCYNSGHNYVWRHCDGACDFFIGNYSASFWVCLVLSFLLYFVEFFFSSARKYLANTVDNLVLLYDTLNALKAKAPSIWMKVDNYHWEVRTRIIDETDAQGISQQRVEIYNEMVVTSTFRQNFEFGSWRDVSQSFDGLEEYKVTRLTVEKHFTFGNDETRLHWTRVAEKFQQDHRMDVHQSFAYDMEIDGYWPKYLCELEEGMKPDWVSARWLYLSTFLLLSPLYRTAVSSVVGRASYQLIKEVSI